MGKHFRHKSGNNQPRTEILHCRATGDTIRLLSNIKNIEDKASIADVIEYLIEMYQGQACKLVSDYDRNAKKPEAIKQLHKVLKKHPSITTGDKVYKFNQHGICINPTIVLNYDSKRVRYSVEIAYDQATDTWAHGTSILCKSSKTGSGGGGWGAGRDGAFPTKQAAIRNACNDMLKRMIGYKKLGLVISTDMVKINECIADNKLQILATAEIQDRKIDGRDINYPHKQAKLPL